MSRQKRKNSRKFVHDDVLIRNLFKGFFRGFFVILKQAGIAFFDCVKFLIPIAFSKEVMQGSKENDLKNRLEHEHRASNFSPIYDPENPNNPLRDILK